MTKIHHRSTGVQAINIEFTTPLRMIVAFAHFKNCMELLTLGSDKRTFGGKLLGSMVRQELDVNAFVVIKSMRDQFGCGLKEAKDFVDFMRILAVVIGTEEFELQ